MSDWRLRDQELYLMNVSLNKIEFPDFWVLSFNSKNEFYKMIACDAEEFVKNHGRGSELLNGLSIGRFWHTHCDFCMKEINTVDANKCYCTDDYGSWICEDCFNDFYKKFNWVLK